MIFTIIYLQVMHLDLCHSCTQELLIILTKCQLYFVVLRSRHDGMEFFLKEHSYDYQGMSCEGACACEIHSEKCAGCACVRLVFGHAMCDRILATFGTKLQENAILECPIPL